MIKLGNKVRDMVTGLEGIAISRIEYLNGCVQYGVRPKVDKDGKSRDAEYIDIAELKVVGKGVAVDAEPNGGPVPDGVPRKYGI